MGTPALKRLNVCVAGGIAASPAYHRGGRIRAGLVVPLSTPVWREQDMAKLRVALSALVSALLVTLAGVSAVSAAPPPPKIDAKAAPVPSWIWADKTADNQTLGLRGTFELPGDLK